MLEPVGMVDSIKLINKAGVIGRMPSSGHKQAAKRESTLETKEGKDKQKTTAKERIGFQKK